jgi:hypothetical protein
MPKERKALLDALSEGVDEHRLELAFGKKFDMLIGWADSNYRFLLTPGVIAWLRSHKDACPNLIAGRG